MYDEKDSVSSYHNSDLGEDEPEVPVSLDVYNVVVPTIQTLGTLIRDFPHIPEEQRKAWKRSVSQLSQAPPSTFKYVFIGRTGSGKSTLLNCVLGAKILPTSASLTCCCSACTSTVYEITYQESSIIEMTIKFKSKSEWLPNLTYLLEDAQNDSDTSRTSKEALCLVYPHLRDANLARITTNELLKKVQPRLGASLTTRAANAEDCRTQIREYLHNANTDISAPWPLVSRVEIRGKFPVLASGITLVDLPGDGDVDDMRNNFVNEYIANADGFVLVSDIKRVQDDRGTHDHLRTILTQLILDGRVVDETAVLVATHTDNLIGEDELQLDSVDQHELNELLKELKELSNAVKKTKGQRSKSNQQLALDFRVKTTEKAHFLANIRIASVREKVQDIFTALESDLGSTAQPKMFCVGSRDYLALDSLADLPLVFTHEAQTEIPDLVAHLCKTGQRRRLRWATDQLDRASAFCEGVYSYFSEGRHPGQLTPERKQKLLTIIRDLERRNLEEAAHVFRGIEDELKDIQKCVNKAVRKATKRAPTIMEDFGLDGKMQWNTYKATMRMNGVFPPHDLNRDLTSEIIPDVQRSWNLGINHRIPLILKDATKTFEQSTRTVINRIVQSLNGQGPTFRQAIATAHQSLAIECIFSDLLQQSRQTITFAQRDGTRSFKTILQTEMAPQYATVSQISGIGTWERMRVSNQVWIEDNAETAFMAIHTYICDLFRGSLAKMKKDISAELRELTTLLRLALIEDINLSHGHKATKDEILRTIAAKRPVFESRTFDLKIRWRALGYGGQDEDNEGSSGDEGEFDDGHTGESDEAEEEDEWS